MFKLGIYTPKQTADFKKYPRRFIALDLYDQFQGDAADRDAFEEHAIGRLAVANGSFKKTHKNRFNEFDAACFDTIEKYVSLAKAGISVHDIAVSDGRTTVPFFNGLSDIFGEGLKFLASDYSAKFTAVYHPQHSARRVILDGQNNLIQFVVPPFVFNTVCPESSLLYPLNAIIRTLFQKIFAEKWRGEYLSAPRQFKTRDILVLCGDCRELMRDPCFSFETYDVLSGTMGRHDIIRAMNILNPSYFTPAKMAVVVKNILSALNDDGIFITGSNGDVGTVVNGGIYQKQNGQMIMLKSFGVDSPVADLLGNNTLV